MNFAWDRVYTIKNVCIAAHSQEEQATCENYESRSPEQKVLCKYLKYTEYQGIPIEVCTAKQLRYKEIPDDIEFIEAKVRTPVEVVEHKHKRR